MEIPKYKVRRIDFGIMTADQIREYGVCEITDPSTEKNKMGGLYDPRMGPTADGEFCKSCGQTKDHCPGHFGYINLNTKIIHYGFIEYIYKILQLVCWNCSRLLAVPASTVPPEDATPAILAAHAALLAELERVKRLRKGPVRLAYLHELIKKKCPHCGRAASTFKRVEGIHFDRIYTDEDPATKTQHTERLTGDAIYDVFKEIPEADVELMGFDPRRSHPKDMIISVFPVSPPAVRPAVDMVGDGKMSQDDLTHILHKIIMVNHEYSLKKGDPKDQADCIEMLTAYITAYINNDLPSRRPVLSKTGRPYKAISQRLKGKEGRVRGNLMGKRVDFSGRTVITPDPNLDIDEVGVPRSIAMTLTVPEYVNALNIAELERLVKAGPDNYPGAKRVIKITDNGHEESYALDSRNSSFGKLEPGRTIVERHLKTGDIVVFNRQPSLHKMSMMGHRARVMPFSSFRLNLCVTTPYNADFDGDEMNLHVPQDLAARAEVRELMMVPKNIVAPASNRPVMGIVQDSLLGSMLMTQPSTFVDKDCVFNTLCWLSEWNWKVPLPAIIKAPGKPSIMNSTTSGAAAAGGGGTGTSSNGNRRRRRRRGGMNSFGDEYYNDNDMDVEDDGMDYDDDDDDDDFEKSDSKRKYRGAGAGGPLWTGKQLFSKVMPDISLTRGDLATDIKKGREKTFKFQENTVVISHGELLCGVIKKNLIGPSSSGGITHTIWKELGPESAKIFLGQTQKVVNSWLLQRGFSIGICDNIPDEIIKRDVSNTLDKAFKNVEEQIRAFRNGSTEEAPGFTKQQTFEINVNKTLNAARKDAGDNANRGIDHRNSIKCTVDSGSKGNAINISQILACVGQQNVEGKRIPFGFANRTLPHFSQYDEGHLSRGFVVHSYLAGLTPQEFFFHAMGGREGLSDTAVKTSETGYTQRRLMKSMEDMQCKYDGTVRDTTGTVLQFLYGEDSFDATYMEKHEPFLIGASDADMEARYRFTPEEIAHPGPATGLTPEVCDLLTSSEPTRVRMEQEYATLLDIRRFYREEYTNPNDPSTSDQGDPNIMTEIAVPCNVRRCIAVVSARHNINALSMPDQLTPIEIIDDVDTLIEALENALPSPLMEAKQNALTLFSAVIREFLAVKRVLCYYRLNKTAWHEVIETIKDRFVQAIAAPGESVGPLAAQSIGEPATQMTLNTFHYAGVSEKNVTLGVPRLKELIDVAKTIKTPLLTITLAEDKNDSEYAKEVLGSIEHTSIRDVVTTSSIYFDPYSDNPTKAGDVEPANTYYETHIDSKFAQHHDDISPWVLCYKLNETQLNLKKITARDVVNKILETTGGNSLYIFSIKSRLGIYIYIRLILIPEWRDKKNEWYAKTLEEDEEDDDDDNDNDGFYDDDEAEEEKGAGEDGDADWENCEVLALMRANTAILAAKISGIENINSASIKKVTKVRLVPKDTPYPNEKPGAFFKPIMDEDNKEKYPNESVHRILASGTNFAEILTHPMVNFERTSSNDVMTVYNVLGIEGARSTLLYELRKVLSFDNSYVNDRHIGILADTMTQTGKLVAVSRHGINKNGTSGPLMRASFEETASQFMQAGAFSEADLLKGISGNVMLGQLAPLGTGSICVVLDTEKLKDAREYVDTRASEAASDPARGWDGPDESFSPNYSSTPLQDPYLDSYGSFSPTTTGVTGSSPIMDYNQDLYGTTSPAYSPSSPNIAGGGGSGGMGYDSASYSPSSPGYSISSPNYSPSSPRYDGPSSPKFGNSSSPRYGASYSPSSPKYSGASAGYSPSSPKYSGVNAGYSPSSPKYSGVNAGYSPSSPKYSGVNAGYSPSSPKFGGGGGGSMYSPSSPRYSPNNSYLGGNQDLSSPKNNGGYGGGNQDPNSIYSPSSPAAYSPSSPSY